MTINNNTRAEKRQQPKRRVHTMEKSQTIREKCKGHGGVTINKHLQGQERKRQQPQRKNVSDQLAGVSYCNTAPRQKFESMVWVVLKNREIFAKIFLKGFCNEF